MTTIDHQQAAVRAGAEDDSIVAEKSEAALPL